MSFPPPSMAGINIPSPQEVSGRELYYSILDAVQKMLSILNTVKTKLDEFFRPSSSSSTAFPKDMQEEFVKGLVSHLAFTADKMIKIIPDLDPLAPSQDSRFLRGLLMKQTQSLQEIVYNFVESTQKQNLDEYLRTENTQRRSVELDEVLAHMDQTLKLLRAPSDDPGYSKMLEALNYLEQIRSYIDDLLQITMDAQGDANASTAERTLREEGPKSIVNALDVVAAERKDFSDRDRIYKEMKDLLAVACSEATEIAHNLTHDPAYAEEKEVTLRNLVENTFFLITCDLQFNLLSYPLKIKPKPKEVMELDLNPTNERKCVSLPHMESSAIGEYAQENRAANKDSPKGFTKRKRRLTDRLPRLKRNSTKISHSQVSKMNKEIAMSEEITPRNIPLPSVSVLKSHHSARNAGGLLSVNKSRSLPATDLPNQLDQPTPSPEQTKTESDSEHSETNIPSARREPPRDFNQGRSLTPPHTPTKSKSVEMGIERTTSIRFNPSIESTSSKEEENPTSFQSKRPKISRMVSKSRILQMDPASRAELGPEHEIGQEILKALIDELPWFGEAWEDEHVTGKFRVENRLEALIKKHLVMHGNRIRTAQRKSVTPRDSLKPKDLGQFVSREVMTSDSWKGLFQSTATILTPLEIPRLRSCVSPLGCVADQLIGAALAVVHSPSDRRLPAVLTEHVQGYYSKLRQIVKISISGPERQKVTSFLEKPLDEILLDSPVEGEVNQELINTDGEDYQLQMILDKIRQRVYHTANNFRALVIQIGSSINSIELNSQSISDTLVVQLVSNICSQLRQISQLLNLVATSSEFLFLINNNQSRDGRRLSESFGLDPLVEGNIWESSPPKANTEFRLGNLNSFVLTLTQTENEVDNYFQKAFLATYQSFTTPSKLFRKLVERYNVPSTVDEVSANKVRLRVIIMLKHWIKTQFYDINNRLLEDITNFLSAINEPGLTSISQQLQKLLAQKEEDRKAFIQRIEEGELPALHTNQLYDINPVSPADLLFSTDPEQIAQEITMQDSTIFQTIELSELLNQAWNSTTLRYQSPNVVRFIHSLNKLSFWVATSILWYGSVQKRSQVVEKFIRIAVHLRKIGNFNGLMGIMGGLNLGCISRLKITFMGISEKLDKELRFFNDTLMVHKQSWKKYRESLQAQPLPRLPYLGVHLSDLTAIEDGNPSKVDGYVNFDKQLMIYKVMEQILICQQQAFNFPQSEPLRTFYSELPSLGEDELWHLSEMREPRACAAEV